jgi:hypothetical protein
MGETLKVVWAKFSTLSWGIIILSVIVRHRQGRQTSAKVFSGELKFFNGG